ncbi:MAG: hypothetical protein U1F54_18235 [Burkholderiales bacterium]
MASSNRFAIVAPEAEQFFARVADWLQRTYGERPGFVLREGLYWPKPGYRQYQLDLYLGPRAGFEIAYRGRKGAHAGEVVVRPNGALNDKLKVAVAGTGVVAALAVFLLLLAEGLAWGTFIVPYPVRAYGGPHLSFGAIVVYAFVPAVALGFVASGIAWPLRWLGQPLTLSANGVAGLPSVEAFASAIRHAGSGRSEASMT